MGLTHKPEDDYSHHDDLPRRNKQLIPDPSLTEKSIRQRIILFMTQALAFMVNIFSASTKHEEEAPVDQLGDGLARAYYIRGDSRYEKNDLHGALADYTKAINLNDQLMLAYIHRGNVCYELDYLDYAKRDYSRAIELDPTNALAYCNRGNIHTKQQHYNQALSDYNQAAALNPTLLLIYWGRGVLYRKMGQYEAALDDFYRYLNLAANTDHHEMFEKWIFELEQML